MPSSRLCVLPHDRRHFVPRPPHSPAHHRTTNPSASEEATLVALAVFDLPERAQAQNKRASAVDERGIASQTPCTHLGYRCEARARASTGVCAPRYELAHKRRRPLDHPLCGGAVPQRTQRLQRNVPNVVIVVPLLLCMINCKPHLRSRGGSVLARLQSGRKSRRRCTSCVARVHAARVCACVRARVLRACLRGRQARMMCVLAHACK